MYFTDTCISVQRAIHSIGTSFECVSLSYGKRNSLEFTPEITPLLLFTTASVDLFHLLQNHNQFESHDELVRESSCPYIHYKTFTINSHFAIGLDANT